MDGNPFATSTDLRFGIAVSDGAAEPPGCAGLSTAEFTPEAWKRFGPAWESDLSLRLGGVLADPGAARGEYARALSECRAAAEALRPPGRLSALLLEFPPSFSYRAAERRHLDRVLKDLENFPLAVAFLNGEWYSSRVIEGLKARNVALCLLDLPPGDSGPPRVDIATSSLVYMRCSAPVAPAAWIPRLEAASSLAERVRVVFDAGNPGEAACAAAALARLWAKRRGAD